MMLNTKRLWFALGVAAAATACDPVTIPIYVPSKAGVTPPHEIKVWSDPAAYMPAQDVFAACRTWKILGVHCVQVSRAEWADLSVTTTGGDCVLDAEGLPTNAVVWESAASVEFRATCFRNSSDRWDGELFKLHARRMFGVAFGIDAYVPESCVDPSGLHNGASRHSNGTYICGPAVMNERINADIRWPTPADYLAFQMRDRDRSRLVALPKR